jgi:hypothetical protein
MLCSKPLSVSPQERESEKDAHRTDAEVATALAIQTLAANADAAFEEGRKVRLEMDRTLKQLQTMACHVAALEGDRETAQEAARALGVALAVHWKDAQSRAATSARGNALEKEESYESEESGYEAERKGWETSLKAALADRDKALVLVEEARRKESAAVAAARKEAEARARALEVANAHVEEMRVALAEAEAMADAAEVRKGLPL